MDDISALILMGGKSSRFGSPKGLIVNHTMLQWQYMYALLQAHCNEVYFSLNSATRACYPDIEESKILYDNEHTHTPVRGPMAGVLAAMNSYRQRAWLVVSIDLLFLTHQTINKLLNARQLNTLVTAYYYEEIQPLCAIYEHAAYRPLSHFAAKGNYSLLKAIKSMQHTLISVEEDRKPNTMHPVDQIHKHKYTFHPLSNVNSITDLPNTESTKSHIKGLL